MKPVSVFWKILISQLWFEMELPTQCEIPTLMWYTIISIVFISRLINNYKPDAQENLNKNKVV